MEDSGEYRVRVGMYKGAHRFMLTALELVKLKNPGNYASAVMLAEEMREYFMDASDITDAFPLPEN